MKLTLTQTQYVNKFNKIRPNHFSNEGLRCLFDYFEELDESTETETEFDPIATCCEWAEYDSIEEFWDEYDKDDYEDIEAIQDMTEVIELSHGAFIILQF
jgi:hypothetical protein